MIEHMIFKALMAASIGVTFVSLSFFAPSGAGMTTSASPEKVQAQPGQGPERRTRGPRYVFIGGYRGGK